MGAPPSKDTVIVAVWLPSARQLESRRSTAVSAVIWAGDVGGVCGGGWGCPGWGALRPHVSESAPAPTPRAWVNCDRCGSPAAPPHQSFCGNVQPRNSVTPPAGVWLLSTFEPVG